ncbi:cardiolipin synthase ClsB [Chitiniphilus purpureus]|uniref:Cardiolipin synthase B n=1 Tax=Chitiniphilus purpureus TaxID=2981137 RepID=A0ABY6DIG9_9NEIS|nr:cardiolipin synthase ClsB [Chitiniphilus sp. CD1]UXY14131.1 cardiolipin synthase ClsB [Chitiniphilus sp. CD1]
MRRPAALARLRDWRLPRAEVFLPGHRVRLLYNGSDFFPLLLGEIECARVEIFLESYLFEADDIGERVVAALAAAALRGVRVKLQVDGFGARQFPLQWQQRLADAGAWLLFFRPNTTFSVNRSRLRRLHRKLAVIDGRVGFVGGINILSDQEPGQSALAPRYDYAFRVEGPVVAQMHDALDRLWRHSAWVQLKRSWAVRSTVPVDVTGRGDVAAAFAIRDNLRHRHDIEHAYLRAIRHARHEIVIANAYFLPGYRFRQALRAAAARGVTVVLVLQGQVDQFLLHWATRAYYRRFLLSGMHIHEYQAGFMHAKAAVIDGEWATVGSSNLDPFSLLLAREANVFVRDRTLAGELRDDIFRHIERAAAPVRLTDLRRGGLMLRALVWGCFGLVRLIMSLTRYGGPRYLE